MVAGDLVNTASRVQGLAEPGTVLTDDATRRATESAVAFEPAGAHEVKGKAEPIALYRATRVIGGRGGALRSVGLEAPFVGRDRELRILKDLFHMCVDYDELEIARWLIEDLQEAAASQAGPSEAEGNGQPPAALPDYAARRRKENVEATKYVFDMAAQLQKRRDLFDAGCRKWLHNTISPPL